MKFDNARNELAEYANSPEHPDVFQADTIEELAELMGLDAQTVRESIDTYNGYCDGGLDLDFGKSDWLWKVEAAPFYAAKLKSAVYTTCGGLKIDSEAEVLDTDGNPIGGLYACGGDAGGLYGDSYDVIICAGSQAGQTINFGRIADDQAKAYIDK
jgi:fumarate reductase flavoprotein subunit